MVLVHDDKVCQIKCKIVRDRAGTLGCGLDSTACFLRHSSDSTGTLWAAAVVAVVVKRVPD